MVGERPAPLRDGSVVSAQAEGTQLGRELRATPGRLARLGTSVFPTCRGRPTSGHVAPRRLLTAQWTPSALRRGLVRRISRIHYTGTRSSRKDTGTYEFLDLLRLRTEERLGLRQHTHRAPNFRSRSSSSRSRIRRDGQTRLIPLLAARSSQWSDVGRRLSINRGLADIRCA